jgi:hypothetical protein
MWSVVEYDMNVVDNQDVVGWYGRRVGPSGGADAPWCIPACNNNPVREKLGSNRGARVE